VTVLHVNGEMRTVEAAADCPLLYALRNDLGLKGARFGCGEGHCGACSVLVDGRAVHACDTPLWSVEGKSITTVEGIMASASGPSILEGFVGAQAGQCGYCLSGIVVVAEALLRSDNSPSREDIAAALKDNLCRCGAHARILDAIEQVAAERRRTDHG
jgi:nicotinate dehydrogenase subunit A